MRRISRPRLVRLGLVSAMTVLLLVLLPIASATIIWNAPFTGGTSLASSTVGSALGSGVNSILITPTFSTTSGIGSAAALSYAGPTTGGTYSYDPVQTGVELQAWTCPPGCPSILTLHAAMTVKWNSTEKLVCSTGVNSPSSVVDLRSYAKVADTTAGTSSFGLVSPLIATLVVCGTTWHNASVPGGQLINLQTTIGGAVGDVYVVSVYVWMEITAQFFCTPTCASGTASWASADYSSVAVGQVSLG
jgi:hypothetical protein